MTYGRTPAQELRLEGRRLLTRHYYGDGRWGWRPRSAAEQRTWDDWRIVKHRPKRTTWAIATGQLGRKVHAIRYSLVATHPSGETVRMTVWHCGQYAHSKVRPQSHPPKVCANCYAKLAGAHEVALTENRRTAVV